MVIFLATMIYLFGLGAAFALFTHEVSKKAFSRDDIPKIASSSLFLCLIWFVWLPGVLGYKVMMKHLGS